jgi:hypothetical protein
MFFSKLFPILILRLKDLKSSLLDIEITKWFRGSCMLSFLLRFTVSCLNTTHEMKMIPTIFGVKKSKVKCVTLDRVKWFYGLWIIGDPFHVESHYWRLGWVMGISMSTSLGWVMWIFGILENSAQMYTTSSLKIFLNLKSVKNALIWCYDALLVSVCLYGQWLCNQVSRDHFLISYDICNVVHYM